VSILVFIFVSTLVLVRTKTQEKTGFILPIL